MYLNVHWCPKCVHLLNPDTADVCLSCQTSCDFLSQLLINKADCFLKQSISKRVFCGIMRYTVRCEHSAALWAASRAASAIMHTRLTGSLWHQQHVRLPSNLSNPRISVWQSSSTSAKMQTVQPFCFAQTWTSVQLWGWQTIQPFDQAPQPLQLHSRCAKVVIQWSLLSQPPEHKSVPKK